MVWSYDVELWCGVMVWSYGVELWGWLNVWLMNFNKEINSDLWNHLTSFGQLKKTAKIKPFDISKIDPKKSHKLIGLSDLRIKSFNDQVMISNYWFLFLKML